MATGDTQYFRLAEQEASKETDALLAQTKAARAKARELEEKADETVNKISSWCGGDTWCNKVVDKRQLEDYPAMTLLVARVCKIMLVFFIVICTTGLLTGFLFQGSLELLEEVNQMDELPAPHLAVCPQPWGAKFAVAPTGLTATLVTIPSGKMTVTNFTNLACPKHADQCHCTDFSAVIMKPRGDEKTSDEFSESMEALGGEASEKVAKRGELTEWEYLLVEFKAENPDKNVHQYAFGFYDTHLPQQWTYATLGTKAEGDIRYEEVAHGKTEFTDGEPVSRYSFRLAGESPLGAAKDGRTGIQFGYDRFLAYVIASVGSKWSIFSVMTLLITFCAAINNFGLFEIFFPEKLDEDDPAQLVPNQVLTMTCGRCCICCNPRETAAEDV